MKFYEVIESILIFIVRTFKIKKTYSLAWRYSEILVKKEKNQKRIAKTTENFLIQGSLDDYLFRSIYFTGEYEKEVFGILKQIIQPDQVWFDLGANIGYFTLFFAKNSKHVIAIDANESMINLLGETVKKNGFGNVTLVNRAISDTAFKEIEFYICDQDLGRSSAVRYDDLSEVRKVKIQTTTIDHVLESYQKKPFGLKIDIEGLEIAALSGAKELLNHHSPKVILMELSQRPGGLSTPQEIIELLISFKYHPHLIRDNALIPFSSEKDLDPKLDPNAFFIHESYLSSIRSLSN